MAQALARVKHRLVHHSDKHRRAFDFRHLEPFGDRFATALAEELLRVFEDGLSTGTAIQYHDAFRLALRWIAERAERCPELFGAVAALLARVAERFGHRNPNSLKHYLNDIIRRYSASDIEVSELVEERRETVRLRRPEEADHRLDAGSRAG